MHGTGIGAVGADLARLFEAGAAGPVGDAELIRRFVDGRGDPSSEAAFAAIVERHGGVVRGVGRRVTGDAHAADDVAQAVFLVLARKARTIRCDGDGSLAPWLHAVGVRLALRARKARRTADLEGVDPPAGAPAPGPDERSEVMAAIDAEIARLPGRSRVAVVLCHVEGLDHREAARRLRCPLGTLESRLHRARGRLRRALARRGLAPAGGIALTLHGLRSHAASPALVLPATARSFVGRAAMKALTGAAAVAVGLVGLGAGTAALAPPATAAPEEPAGPPRPAPGPSVGEQIRAILAEWDLDRQKHDVAMALAITDELMDRTLAKFEARSTECSARLLPLVESQPADPAALDAMLWHLSKYWGTSRRGAIHDQFDRSVDVLIRHYADESRVAWRALVSLHNIPLWVSDRLVPRLAAAARRREPKGLALMALAEYLETKAGRVARIQKTDGALTFGSGKSKSRAYDEAYEASLRACDAAALRREAEAAFARVVDEFGDVVMVGRDPGDPDFPIWVVSGPIGDEAADRLAALRGVAVGKPAPDLGWSNRDGSTSRLSDFRGKVVVLKFWADGDPGRPHRDFDHDARLARDLEGRPFVLVGFSTRHTLPFARPDGTEAVAADGPIRDRLGVRRLPSTIVVDADGVLGLRCGTSVLLDGYLRKLVEQAEAKPAR